MKKQFIENETENVGNRSPSNPDKGPKIGVLPAGTIVYKKCRKPNTSYGDTSRNVIVKMISV